MGLLFTYALTYGGAVISLFNPFNGLLIYVCFAIIRPPALWHWSVAPGNYSRIIGVAFLLGWALNGFGDRNFGAAKRIIGAALGYFACAILATTFSAYPEGGLRFIEEFAKIILPVMAGLTLIKTRRQLEQLLWVIVGSCAFVAYEANLAYVQGLSIERWGFLGTDNNTFAIYIVTGFGLALVYGLEDAIRWRRYMYLGAAAMMAHVPMLAFSRGGMLGIGVAALAAMALIPKNPRTWTAIVAVCIGGSVLAGPSVIAEFNSSFEVSETGERDPSADSRIYLWQDCTDVALKNPFVGIGPGGWRRIAHTYGWPPGKAAHSLWFQTAAELGFPGLAFLMLFYYRVVKTGWRLSKSPDPFDQTLGRGVIASILGFGVSATFLSIEGLEIPYYVSLAGACAYKLQSAQRWRQDDLAYDENHFEGAHLAPT